jgi:hypothetical protein
VIALTREEAQQVLDAFVNWDARGRLRLIETLRARLAQPEQRTGDCLLTGVCAAEGHRVQKAQREWQGLTDEEASQIWDGHIVPVFGKNGINPIVFARAIEAKLKEKNT